MSEIQDNIKTYTTFDLVDDIGNEYRAVICSECMSGNHRCQIDGDCDCVTSTCGD